MLLPTHASLPTDLDEMVFADLVERMNGFVLADQGDQAEALIVAHPEHADRLRRVLPAIEAVAQLDDGLLPGESSLGRADIAVSRTLGDFRILGEVGRGGMGIVYEAEQISLGRHVALKVLPMAAMLDERRLQRFKHEAHAAAMLRHPHIVTVYSVGCERGVHYYAMDYINGPSLHEVVAQLSRPNRSASVERASGAHTDAAAARDARSSSAPSAVTVRAASDNGSATPVPPNSQSFHAEAISVETERLAQARTETTRHPAISTSTTDAPEFFCAAARLGAQAAEALHFAHQMGVVHRDVKPSNLLVDAAGHLWITDFGLAMTVTDASLTMTGDLLGTLRYMSPEQSQGSTAVLDHRSDIYSLGVTLYELLTLRPAYPGDDRQELLRQIAFEEPRPPRRVNAHIPQDLETIVLKAIEKEPGHRYATAQELADDLRRFVAHEPIRARPATLLHRLTKWSRRHSAVVAAVLTTLFVALTVTTFVVMWANQSERFQRKLAEASQQRAQRSLTLAREAVDEMLTKVATTWVADSTATSEVQRAFLQRALAIYIQLANDPPDGDRHGADAALAYERISDIENQLGNSDQAISSLQIAVEIGQKLTTKGSVVAHAEQLVRCYRKLAGALTALSILDEAQRATDQGVDLAQRLLNKESNSPQLKRELARLLYGRAQLLIQDGKFSEAAAVVAQPEAQFADRQKSKKNAPLDDLELGAQLTNLRTTILFQQGRFDEAVKIGRDAVSERFFTNGNYTDAKRLVELDAELVEILGEVFLAQGKPDDAVYRFRSALGLRKQRLGGREPIQLNLALLAEPWHHDELSAEADYCSTQLRLAAALPSIGRPYEAECTLGEALNVAGMINGFRRDILEFWVLHANVATAVGQRLTDRQSVEGEHYLQLAAALWSETRLQFPQAEQYQSGAHGLAPDWDWFRATYPDFASRSGTRKSLQLADDAPAFWNQTLGRAWFQKEDWESAAHHFLKSAELGSSRQAYDRLYLAMSYHHLGQQGKAKSEYVRANAQMKEAVAADAELDSLRRTTARLLAEGDSPNSK